MKTNKANHKPATCKHSDSIWSNIHMSQNQMQPREVYPLMWMFCAVAYAGNKDKQTMTEHKRSNQAEDMSS